MKNKINKFFLESIVMLLPLCISYIILGIWLSDVTDIGRAYVLPPDVTNLREVYGSVVKYGYIEFDSYGKDYKSYNFEVSQIYWGAIILSVLLLVFGRLLALGVMQVIEKRAKIKSVIRVDL